jgi:SAM-dependent methyltransferase
VARQSVTLASRLLQHSAVYRTWQAPFATGKFAPVERHNDLRSVRRVLDVGCGPGTNTDRFAGADYLGIDINPAYIADARSRHQRAYIVADVTTYAVDSSNRFDFVLANSFLHHVATPDVRRILAHLATLLADDGHVHILDLVLPDRPSVSRLLARWDRGDFARPVEMWRALFAESFEPVIFEPYAIGMGGVTLWNMVYFKGRRRRDLTTAPTGP